MHGLCLLVFLALLAPPPGSPPLPFTDAIVVTATGEEESLADVSAAATVIDRKEIASTGGAAAGDLLRRVPGATLLRSGLDNNVASLFVRGTGTNQTLVLFDGVRLSSPFFGGYDWSLPLAFDLERIEVVRGPYSALYGGDAIGGVVHLVPHRATKDGLRVLIEGGGSAWRRGELGASLAVEDWHVTLGAAERTGSGSLANDDFSSRQVLADASRDLPGGGRVGVLVRRAEGRAEIPFDGARISPDRRTEQTETIVAVPVLLLVGGTEVEATVSHVERSLRFRDPDDPWGLTASDTRANSDGARVAARRTLEGHHLTFGGEWRRDVVDDASSFGPNLSDRRQVTSSAFVQDAVTLRGGFSILGGLRWDRATNWDGRLSPRVTVAWAGKMVRGWVSHGSAFRAPGLGELHYPLAGNPDLEPERSRSGEVGLRTEVVDRRVNLQIVAFRNRVDHLIDYDYVSQRFANVERAAQDGVEVAVAAACGEGRAHLSLTWLDARDGTGAPLLRRPQWSSALGWYGPLSGGLEGAFQLVWVGQRPDLDPASFATIRLGGFVTADAAIAVPLGRGFRGRLRATNLAGRRYQEVAGYPAPGRRVMVALEAVIK